MSGPKPFRARALDGVPHGFFGREGGLSRGVVAGLNCGRGAGDDPEIVAQNRRLAVEAILPDAHLASVYQIHSPTCVTLAQPWDEDDRPEADALVTDRPGIALGIVTADCAPVLLADREAGVIGAAHAGWRGALDGILEATVSAMETLGAARGRIAAVIGPCISQRAYEVGPEFFEEFIDRDRSYDRFFIQGAGDRMLFDLPGFGLKRLRDAGVGQAEWTRHCTYSDPDRFYSYRRTTHAREADYGRLISAIAL